MIITETTDIIQRFQAIRHRTEEITRPLEIEDYVVQPIVDVSPPKWHLAHTSWFFETFILKRDSNYKEFDPHFNFLFNSYYESVGARTIRTDRGNITRPGVKRVLDYRKHVNEAISSRIKEGLSDEETEILNLGLQHEQQHQELLVTDIKYILGHNPIFPIYNKNFELFEENPEIVRSGVAEIEGGIYEIGYRGDGFCFDNELGVHEVLLSDFEVYRDLVTNGEYLEFINDSGYDQFILWHADGWDWVQSNNVKSPMYWHKLEGEWHQFTLEGLQNLDLNAPVSHISFYEAHAFAEWKNMRLLTEFEFEAAYDKLNTGSRWEWTNSAYLPYPGYQRAEGAIGEYNGKFMVNQMVLRGGSCATPPNHFRRSYRNFFHPHLQWQFSGIRLAKKLKT